MVSDNHIKNGRALRIAIGILAIVIIMAAYTGVVAAQMDVTLNPTEGATGTQVTTTGNGWHSGQAIYAIWDQFTELGGSTVDSNGNFVIVFNVPQAEIGQHNVIFLEENPPGQGPTPITVYITKPFTVTSPAVTPTPTPTPTVTPTCNPSVTPPTISSVSGQILPRALGWSITINGACFGNVFPTVYTQSDGSVTTQPSIITPAIVLVNQGTSGTVFNWGAGFGNDLIGIYLASWTDNAITINGFGSSYVPSRYGIASDDQIFIYIVGPNCQESTTPQWPTISNPPPASVWPSNCLAFTSTTVSSSPVPTPTPTPTAGPIHNINKGTNYTTIQAAINDANPDDEIHVDSGTYYENVNVTKQIILKGIDTGNGKPIIDANGMSSIIIYDAGGVTVEGFTVINNTNWFNAGIVIGSNNNMILNNDIKNNLYGLHINNIHGGTKNNIENNNLSNNSVAIELYDAQENTFIRNTLKSNKLGISFRQIAAYENFSVNNSIYLNNFIDNANDTYMEYPSNFVNIWNSSTPIAYTYNGSTYTNYLGNYWSDYTGIDADNDIIGDTPYNISDTVIEWDANHTNWTESSSKAQDRYPLMKPWSLPLTIDPLTLDKVWTTDGNGQDKTSFVQGDKIQYIAKFTNRGSYTINLTSTLLVSGPSQIYNMTFQNDIAPGKDLANLAVSIVPVNAPVGTYTLTAIACYNGQNSSSQSQFTVKASTLTPTFNISGFKLNTTGSGIQGWNITLKNSTMKTTILTGSDGSYKFTKLANGTYNVTEEMKTGWTNVSPISQLITINGADMMNINFTNTPVPVILVHGLMEYKDPKDPNAYDWADVMRVGFITQAPSLAVEIFNYEGVNRDINDSAGDLQKEIDYVKNKYNSTKVDIVGHSEGGIVARAYINNNSLYKDDVRKLVMIGSPNHGTDIKMLKSLGPVFGPTGFAGAEYLYYWKAGIAGTQMESHTPFLNWLNDNNNCADSQYGTYSKDKSDPLVHYYIIGSHAPVLSTITHSHKPCLFCVLNYDFLWYSFTPDGDGLTTDNSLNLTGVSSNDIAIIPNVWHSDAPPLMTDQMHSVDIIERAISDIRGDASSSATTIASSATTDNIAIQLSSAAQSVIKPNEVKTHTLFIDSTTKKAYFNLFWPGSDMDLVLYTPSGAKINPSVALNNPNINYTSGAIFKSYEVLSPESGNWTMEITAVNVTRSGENYSVMTLMETSLFVGVATNKELYAPNEPITVAAYVQDNGTPISKVNVTANISRPDGTNSTIQLYDDGLHKDNQSDDGIYANIYNSTNVSGEYSITTTANGIIGNESFERKAFKNVWVESINTVSPPVNVGSGGSSGGGGGGGGGGGTSGENYSNIEVKEKYDLNIYKDKTTSYAFTDSRNPIVFINITGNVSAGEITTTVEVLRNTSSLVTDPAPGIVNKNVNVWVGTSGFAVPKNINKAVIRFRVENAWISGNRIESNSIRMARWNKDTKKWDTLETSEIMKDSRYTYFDAQTNALSPLAITALKEASSTAMSSYTASITPTITGTTGVTASAPSQGGGLTNFSIILVVFALVGIVIAVYSKRKGMFKK